jgi:SAM-dependent methyltransferase
VNRETVSALDRINREFYARHAEEFLATRASPWPGWDRLLPHLENTGRAAHAPIILDVGCGNGRLGSWLRAHLKRDHRYLGLDRSLALLARASRPRRCVLADVVVSGGRLPVGEAACDAVLALAFLHHIPAFALRRTLIEDLVRVLRPGGVLALSFWQFAAEERLRRRVVAWEDPDRPACPGLEVADLEAGDYLLAWGERAGAQTVRYCHFTPPEEAMRLIDELPLTVIDRYRADGRGGELNLYVVLRRAA